MSLTVYNLQIIGMCMSNIDSQLLYFILFYLQYKTLQFVLQKSGIYCYNMGTHEPIDQTLTKT